MAVRPRRLERRLGEIEADLTLSKPRLAGRLDVFAQRAAGEGPNRPGRVPALGRLPPGSPAPRVVPVTLGPRAPRVTGSAGVSFE